MCLCVCVCCYFSGQEKKRSDSLAERKETQGRVFKKRKSKHRIRDAKEGESGHKDVSDRPWGEGGAREDCWG